MGKGKGDDFSILPTCQLFIFMHYKSLNIKTMYSKVILYLLILLLPDFSHKLKNFIIEPCLMPYANNKGADQPAHPRSLISTFVVRCLDSIVPPVSISEISSL